MIAFARRISASRLVRRAPTTPVWQAGSLALLPDIQRHVWFAFRRLPAERREEAVQEALANALVAFRRLAEQGKADLAYATPLAQLAVKQIATVRQVGCPLNSGDILSRYAQRKRGFLVNRLHRPEATEETWQELLAADRSAMPAELAASRLDFAAWRRRLPQRQRRIAAALAAGATTNETARAFRLTAGRISQLRREIEASWQQFHGDCLPARDAAC